MPKSHIGRSSSDPTRWFLPRWPKVIGRQLIGIGCDCHTSKIWKRCKQDAWQHPSVDNLAQLSEYLQAIERASEECFGSLSSCTSYAPLWRKAVLMPDWLKIMSGWGWTFARMGDSEQGIWCDYIMFLYGDINSEIYYRGGWGGGGGERAGRGECGLGWRENRNYTVTY